MARASDRITAAVAALPILPGMRVLEIGCGPGVAARLVLERTGAEHVLAIDRSAAAIQQAENGCADHLATGRMTLRQVPVEDFSLLADEEPFDLAFALRVGALDGRHPALGVRAMQRLRAALTTRGRVFVDGGDPLRELVAGPAAPLTVDALREQLRRTSVPRDAYRLVEGDADEAWVLDHEASRWVVYYSERGLRTEEATFASEADACADLLERLRSAFDA